MSYPVSDLDPFSRAYLLDPYPFHEQLRAAGPVVWLSKLNCWGTGRHKEMNEILADPTSFNSAAGVGIANFNNEEPWRPPSLLLEADPPAHTKRRAVVGKVLSPANLRRLRADFEREATALVGRILERGQLDAVHDIAEPYILKVFPDAVGLDDDGRENLLAYGAMVFNAFGPRNATCHVHVPDEWLAKLAPMKDPENAMLDSAACERKFNSRLSCQIVMSPALDGIVLHLPQRQI